MINQSVKKSPKNDLSGFNATSQRVENPKKSPLSFEDNRPKAITQLKLQEGSSNNTVVQKRDILGSPKYTANFKARHVRANNVTEDVAAARLNNNPPPPSSTVIDETSVPKSPAKKAEDSTKISEKFELPAKGWNAYIAQDGSIRAKEIQKITVEKNSAALIHHLDSCTEIGNEKVQQADGSWA